MCINFRNLNNATLKDEYHVPIMDMLVDLALEHVSFMDSNDGYN